MADTGSERSGGGLELNQKMAGLPLWGWVGIITAGTIVFMVWRQSHAAKKAPAPAAQPSTQDNQGLPTEQYESLLALLRDVQGKPSVPGPEGPPGVPGPVQPAAVPGPVTGFDGKSGMFNYLPDHKTLMNGYVDLIWNAVDTATTYQLTERSPYGSSAWSTNTVGYHKTGLIAPDTDHTFTVKACNAKGCGPVATKVVHTAGKWQCPNPPCR
jgi:hypothetical protein